MCCEESTSRHVFSFQAEREGVGIEVIAAQRWGSLEKFQQMLAKAEGKDLPASDETKRRRRSRSSSRDRRQRRSRSTSRDRRRHRSRSTSRDRRRHRSRSASRDRRRDRSRDRSRRNSRSPRRDSTPPRRREQKGFHRPTADDQGPSDSSRLHKQPNLSGGGGWKKKLLEKTKETRKPSPDTRRR